MDPKFKAILDDLPANQPRSRLEPYRELILEMRKRGRSYREIVRILKQSCGLSVGASTVNDFVSARTKSISKSRTAVPQEKSAANRSPVALRSTYKNRKSIEALISTPKALAGIARKIKEVRDQPPMNRKKKAVFEYNPDEPLRLQRNQKSEE